MAQGIKTKEGKGKKRLAEKRKKEARLSDLSDQEEPAPKKVKQDVAEPDFSHVRFKYLLRSSETVVTGLQTFLSRCEEGEEEEDAREGLVLLESYLRSSPQCSEVLDLLSPQASSQQISLVFSWVKVVLQKCPSVIKTPAELQQHLVKTVLGRHGHLVVNSLRSGNKTTYIKATLLLLISVASLGYKFAKMLHTHVDFTHGNWPALLTRRNRKDEVDVRACMIALLMTLLQAEDEEITKSLVDQRGLLQGVLLGLKFDRSEYVIHTMNTIHRCIIMNGSIGKNSKIYLFNSPVLKELLVLYRWPGPSQWKSQPSDDEKKDYTEEQQKVAEWVHPVLVDLLTNHKLGICFRDRSYGMSSENKNPALSKVLQSLVGSYSSPLSHQLVTDCLKACPDQTAVFLTLLQPHLSPRPLDTWIACLRFFLRIVENHDWPAEVTDRTDVVTEERASKLVHFLFPPESIINSLKEGLKSGCATVRHQCLQALELIAAKGQRFHSLSKSRMGSQAPLTLGIEGFVSKAVPNGQVLLNLVQKLSSVDSFAVPITRDVSKNLDIAVPHVSRFQHLVAILRVYCLAPEHLTGGPAETLPSLLQLVGEVASSGQEIDRPPEGTLASLPSLYLLHALSKSNVRKLNLFGKGGSKGDLKNSLVFQLVRLMQGQSTDTAYTQVAHLLIVKILAGTGLFDGHQEELAIWLRHLQSSALAQEEVVTWFVGLLHQYMSNPYPAIDRLLDLLEDALHSRDSHESAARVEFSPLVMFALEGEFHAHEKVHQYICLVLIDILHALHKPCAFSRLVHSLSSNLDPEVTRYLTLHSADETLTSESMSSRLCKKLRLKQLKSFQHAGVTVMRRLLKGGQEVKEVVGKVSVTSCLPLVQLCLRYLDELVHGSNKSQAELLNQKLGDICVKTIRAVWLHLAQTVSASIADQSKKDAEKQGDEGNHLELPEMETDWLKMVSTCILTHPLISQWLFEEGFKQGGTSRENLVVELCEVIQCMDLRNRNIEKELPLNIASKCRHMIEAASESGKGFQVPESVQPLLCKCLETLFSVGSLEEEMQGLLTLVTLPMENFMSEPSGTQSPLAHTVCQLADKVQQHDQPMKNISNHGDLESSLKGLLALISVMDNKGLESLALNFLQSAPELSAVCSARTFQGVLKRLETEESCRLIPLLQRLMVHNPQCRSSCAHWLQKKRKVLTQGGQLYHSVMLLYLRVFLAVEESAADDVGVATITRVVSQGLDTPRLAVRPLGATLLQVVCYLINLDKIEPSLVDKLQDSLLSAMQKEGDLREAHVQLLAATLRQQSLLACDLRQERERVENEKRWSEFERKAGQVLVACLRYLSNSGPRGDAEKESCCDHVVHLCQDLLHLPVQPDVKASIASVWPEIVVFCLKYHFKDVQYVALLRQLIQQVFTKEELASEENDDDLDSDEDETTNKDSRGNLSSDEDSDSADDEEDSGAVVSKQNAIILKSETAQRLPTATHTKLKSFRTIVNESARRLNLSERCAVARKCVALFGEERENNTAVRSSEIVSWWTDSTKKNFFLWPCKLTLTSPRTKRTLASPSDGRLMVDLCEKVVGHTGFLSVLQEEELKGVRGELVSLLASLVRLQRACCSLLPLPVLVAAYGATLSLTDQNLLYLMLACDLYGNQRFSPGLWGERAVKQLEAKKEVGRSLLTETKLDNVLQLLDVDVMATSILHFPLLRCMEFQMSESVVKAERMMSRDDCYDPRFLLQLFFHFMGPEHIVDVRTFIAHKGLGFTLAALSSHDALMRKLAIGILCNLRSHVEMVLRWSAAPILLAFLKVVMNGMSKECQKLPCIVTVFLAKAADLVMSPESAMYVAVHSFLMLKPALDVSNVPEFYHFFNSPNPKERVWMLRLLHDGLRETSDHRLFQRRFVYKLLTCHANSSLSDPQCRRETLRVLVKASSIGTVVSDLVTKHGLLPWLLSFIHNLLTDSPEQTHLVCQLLHNVCYTPEFNRQRLWWLSLPRLSRRCLLQVPLLACVRLLLESFSHLQEESLSRLEDILQHPHLNSPAMPTLPRQTQC